MKRVTLETSTRIVNYSMQMYNGQSVDWTTPDIKFDIQVCSN